MTAPIFEAVGLTRRFQGLIALRDVSFPVAPNEILGVIGPNGAGKTTLVSLINGTLSADAGSLSFQGERIDGLSPFRRARLGIGRTFQVMKPFSGLTVVEN